MSLQQAAYFYATKRNISYRNRVGKWKHPQGIALMSLTARSAVFYLFVKYISVMSKSNEKVLVRLTQAQMKLASFLKHECDYNRLMEGSAQAQAEVLHLIRIVNPDYEDEIMVGQISDFFYFATNLIATLKPFDEIKDDL